MKTNKKSIDDTRHKMGGKCFLKVSESVPQEYGPITEKGTIPLQELRPLME